MLKVYRSKVDKWLLGVLIAAMIAGIVGAVSAVAAVGWQAWWAIFPLALAVGLPAWVLTTTYYRLSDSELYIRSGPFSWRVPFDEIQSIEKTNNPLSSPALSLYRLRIKYGNGRSIMISPEDRDAFIEDVKARNVGVRELA